MDHMNGIPFTPEVLCCIALHDSASWGDPVTLRFWVREHLNVEAEICLVFVLDCDVFVQLQYLKQVIFYRMKMSIRSISVQTF